MTAKSKEFVVIQSFTAGNEFRNPPLLKVGHIETGSHVRVVNRSMSHPDVSNRVSSHGPRHERLSILYAPRDIHIPRRLIVPG